MSDCANCPDREELEVELEAKRELIVEVEAFAAEAAHLRARLTKAENSVRHWKGQTLLQRRLREEQGDWKHRALAAELAASDVPGLRTRLAAVEAGLSASDDCLRQHNDWCAHKARLAERPPCFESYECETRGCYAQSVGVIGCYGARFLP